MLSKCDDDELYDVVIISDFKYGNFKNIRIRYLNYVNYFGENIGI